MKNLIQDGKRITWTNGTGSAVSAGDPVVIDGQIGVASVDIADGASGAVAMEGVFELPKTAGNAINQGTAPVFDVSAGEFVPEGTATATGDISGAVVAWETAASGDTVVQVKLNVGIGAVAA